MSKYLKPIKLICYENCENAENVLNDFPVQAILTNNNNRVYSKIKNNGFLLLDFGREINGGICITVNNVDNNDAQFNITFGESVSEALSENGIKNADNYHSIRSYRVPAKFLSTQNIGDIGFRFVKVSAINSDIEISAVKAVKNYYEEEYKGSFECDDELLNKIWKIGAYTVQLNMNHYLWDGIKRDRLVWIGDMHPETSTIGVVYGKSECVGNSLDLIKSETPSDKWMNGYPSYTLWWIIIIHDIFMQFGDIKYLKEQEEYLKGIIDHIAAMIDSGFATGDSVFVDWSSYNSEGEIEGLKAILILALECSEKIFNYLNCADYAEICNYHCRILKGQPITAAMNKRICALNVLAGRKNDDIYEKMKDNSGNEMSCFIGYYILLAKAKLNDYKGAVELIRNYWGSMVKMGATTFWEEFDISWTDNAYGIDELPVNGKKDIHGDFGKCCYTGFRKSLCHGWASGPTPFLSKIIGGIEILEPGCRKVRIKPNLGGLKWIKVNFPTPFGNINIYADGSEVKTDAPKEIEIIN